MDRGLVSWLQSAEATALLPLVDPKQHLQSMSALRKHTDAARAAAVYELALVRAAAGRKFPHISGLFFTKNALEQASHSRVATHRAGRLAGATHIADICCGCGGDLFSLATVAPCTAVDQDDGRLAMAEANLHLLGLRDRVTTVCADATSWPIPTAVDAICFDPGRRSVTGRIYDADAYQPPLATAATWRRPGRRIAIKCAPGLDYDTLPFAPPWSIECVSLDGELRETVVWLDAGFPWQRAATVLSAEETHTLDDTAPTHGVCRAPGMFLTEPDPAVIRSGLVQQLAAHIGAAQIDPHIAYLTHDHPVTTPFARSWQVDAVLPFSERRIAEQLHTFGAGAVTVKKRGSPIDTDALAKRLSRPHGVPMVVVLTRVAGTHTALVCRGPVSPLPTPKEPHAWR